MENHLPTHNAPFADRTTDRPTDRRALLAGIGGLAAGAFLASNANAGPLTPPPGPIAPTPGPEPRIPINSTNTPGNATNTFLITQPGSYYLQGNITGETGKTGIAIVVNDVTLDLNGFSLLGVFGSSRGISVLSQTNRVTIRNGNVIGWGQDGISLASGSVQNCIIEQIIAANNVAAGIRTSSSTVVHRCIATDNGAEGIVTSQRCLVTECIAESNAASGIRTDQSSVVRNCLSVGNTTNGIQINFRSEIQNCFCEANGTGNGGTNGAGIRVEGFSNRILSNFCRGNGRGILVTSSSSLFAGNTCGGNTLNWSVSSGNRCFVVNLPTSGIISGNSGGTTSGTSDPIANFTI